MVNKSQQLYTLQRSTWFDEVSFSKGMNHDRQHLGIVLNEGETIKVCQTNPNFKYYFDLDY